MPHKQKRKQRDEDDYELPPNIIAKPLTTSRSAGHEKSHSTSQKRRRKNNDDTPKEFLRLMNRMKPQTVKQGPNEVRNQRKAPKAKVLDEEGTDGQEARVAAVSMPSILPGERMADFSARVDQALPLNGISARGKVNIEGVKRYRTKLERKITRMQDEWRDTERRLKQKKAEAEEEEEIEAIMNGEDNGRTFRILDELDEAGGHKKGKRKKGGKGQHGGGGEDDSDDDPWAALAKSRKEAEKANSGLVGVHDVVQAPPRLDVQPKEKFKLRDGAMVNVDNVPAASGSLRRREELGKARQQVLKRYKANARREGK